MEDKFELAANALRKAEKVAVLTGAGVSAESGVPTFRASDGLWEGHRIEDVATPMGFARDPELVWKFYNARRVAVQKVNPNPGHYALVQLEERFKPGFTLVTQNIDGLHRRAGSQAVLEVHGNLARTRCTSCADIRDRGYEHLGDRPVCPACGGFLRPDVVWFHESLPEMIWHQSMIASAKCDVFLIIGTSAVVYPAAGLAGLAKQAGATVIECNLTETNVSDEVDIGLYGPSGQTLPKLIELLN